jgi:putative hydrolase of the HAD superfamily
VLLDGLGTLVALEPPWPALTARLLAEHGLPLEQNDAERAFRVEMTYYRAHHHEGRDARTLADLRRRCAEVLRDELPAEVGKRLSLAQLTAAMLGALRFKAYPDAAPALAALGARGLKLVVVSNWDVSLGAVLEETGLAGMLDGVLTSAAVGAPKPAVAIFMAALALAGVPPHQAVHVGDSPAHDVAGARAAGIAPVLLKRIDTHPDGLRGSRRTGAPHATKTFADRPSDVPVIASLGELLA